MNNLFSTNPLTTIRGTLAAGVGITIILVVGVLIFGAIAG